MKVQNGSFTDFSSKKQQMAGKVAPDWKKNKEIYPPLTNQVLGDGSSLQQCSDSGARVRSIMVNLT